MSEQPSAPGDARMTKKLEQLRAARDEYDAACLRAFGGLPIHAGRTGDALTALFAAVDALLAEGLRAEARQTEKA
jgi:hypothetical protein